MNIPLRVLVLADSRSFHTVRYVRELRNQGCRVVIASLEQGQMLHLHLKRIGSISPFHYLFAVYQVRKLIALFKPDIVNAHFATGYGWLAARACRKSGPPILLHLWGSDILQVPQKSFLHRRKAVTALRSASMIMGDSSYLLNRARELSPFEKSQVVYWGMERKYLALWRPERDLNHPLRIIMPRHHEPVYNNEFALRALAPMLSAGIVTITVPNWGSLVGRFRSVCEELGLTGVNFYPRQSRDRFMSLLSTHDVYLSSALSDSSPASLIEACGLGLIPVCVDIPGVREWVDPDSGSLVQPGDGESLRQAVARILESPDACKARRQKNHDRVLQEAIFENNIAQTISAMLSISKGDS